MDDTITEALKILDNSLDPQYSTGVATRKMLMAQNLMLCAIAQELREANLLKKMELRRLYGYDFV